jgi:hypothetical protein
MRPRRTKNTIPNFLSPSAPRNRLAILRGPTPPFDRLFQPSLDSNLSSPQSAAAVQRLFLCRKRSKPA